MRLVNGFFETIRLLILRGIPDARVYMTNLIITRNYIEKKVRKFSPKLASFFNVNE